MDHTTSNSNKPSLTIVIPVKTVAEQILEQQDKYDESLYSMTATPTTPTCSAANQTQHDNDLTESSECATEINAMWFELVVSKAPQYQYDPDIDYRSLYMQLHEQGLLQAPLKCRKRKGSTCRTSKKKKSGKSANVFDELRNAVLAQRAKYPTKTTLYNVYDTIHSLLM